MFLLKKHGVDVNILTLVSSANVGAGAEVYQYLRDEGYAYQQYIPCVEFDEEGRSLPQGISGPAWGIFLCAVFDEWIRHDTHRVSIRFFDSVIHYLLTGRHNLCHLDGDCRQYFVVEHSGDVFPCDFFVNHDLKLGNILRQSWPDLQNNALYRRFGAQKSDRAEECSVCPYVDLCGADCLKHRLNHGQMSPRERSWLCEGYQMFFQHALTDLKRLARQIGQESALPSSGDQVRSKAPKIGRNEPCPCGSGKKYKKCCGR